MKETLIDFTLQMVRAIQEEKKTQTRRLIKPQLEGPLPPVTDCPYGQPGDFLRVTQTSELIEITNVRIEPLQAITPNDAVAEGVEFRGGYWVGGKHPVKGTLKCWPSAERAFQAIWDDIYGDPGFNTDVTGREIAPREYSWAKNPWVWVIEFKRVEARQQIEGSEVRLFIMTEQEIVERDAFIQATLQRHTGCYKDQNIMRAVQASADITRECLKLGQQVKRLERENANLREQLRICTGHS